MTTNLSGETQFIANDDPAQPLSRYSKCRYLLTEDGNVIQETWDPPTIEESIEDQLFEVTIEYAHRPDLISLMYYGTEQLYWVIAYANEMIDPFAETVVGLKLRIPDRDKVFMSILVR
jgi:hypothetical protein